MTSGELIDLLSSGKVLHLEILKGRNTLSCQSGEVSV